MINNKIHYLRYIHGTLYEWRKNEIKRIGKKTRKIRNIFERKRASGKEFTIISNTCIGGVIYNDLGRRFLSPTVNIYIRPSDFVQFCENLPYYLTIPLKEVPYDPIVGYPIVMLGDIVLYCKHYKSFEEVVLAWNRRKKRIIWDNIYIVMTDRDFIPPVSINAHITHCQEQVIRRFEELPYKNKVCIVKSKVWAEKYKSCYQLLKCCDKECVGIITDIISMNGKRMYQYVKNFDYIQYLKGK